jgi:integral membrane protein
VTRGALTRYRVMAYATGVMLLLLVFVAMPMKYIGGDERGVQIVGTIHGWLYLVYLIVAFLLAHRLRWPVGRTILLLLAGTIPFASFVAERKVVHVVRPLLEQQPPAEAHV